MQPRHDGLPWSPPKRTIVLPDVEEARPGPNSFAQQARRMDRHRLESNPFYQKEHQRRVATPPVDVHPALRYRSLSDPPSPPGLRESHMTTMSPFINAGRQDSPELQLVPPGSHFTEPTLRGYIEEHREQLLHHAAGSDEDRTPVYTYAPKAATTDLAKPSSMQKPHVKKEVTLVLPPKSPKKSSFFEKFRKPNLRGSTTSSPATSTVNTPDTATEYTHGSLPPKAKAILGSPTPTQGALPRSPSKRKGFFSSRNKPGEVAHVNTNLNSWANKWVGAQPEDYDEQPRTAGMLAKTPQTGYSDPTSYSTGFQQHQHSYARARPEDYLGQPQAASSYTKTPQTGYSDPGNYNSGFAHKRAPSQSMSDFGTAKSSCTVTRSQSLKYFDHAPPPTPPAKNTPPGQKTGQDTPAKVSSQVPFQDRESTPSRISDAVVSTNERLSPTKYGTYGTREVPRLVTKPSLYSMHASVVPEMTEVSHFEEMKTRMEGLHLEGFSLPSENNHQPSPEMVYTPSIYTSEWEDARPRSVIRSPEIPATIPELPTVMEHPYHSEHRTQLSSSTSGTLPVCYPGLALDPSVTDSALRPRPRQRSEHSDDLDMPHHGQTHSRDHSNSPRLSTDSRLFAVHVDRDESNRNFESPGSIQHPSAMPSPLQYLPATTYTPPAKNTRGESRAIEDTPSHKDGAADGPGLGILSNEHFQPASPEGSINPLATAPVLSARSSSPKRVSPSPTSLDLDDEDMDPRKTDTSTSSQASDKLDQILAMLGNINPRNEEVNAMREEMRATNSRLAMMEQQLKSSPPPTPTGTHFYDDREKKEQIRNQLRIDHKRITTDHQRIATQVAHDFYRLQSTPEISVEDAQKQIQRNLLQGVAQSAEISPITPTTDSRTIANLEEANKRLQDMVQGFASKLEEMERRMNNDGANGRRTDGA